jgi:hypothetical protein
MKTTYTNLKKTFLSQSNSSFGFSKLITAGTVLSLLLITSCSEDNLESSSSANPQFQENSIALVEKPSELIRIKGETTSSDDAAFKRATSAPGVDRGRFNITLKFIVPVTERQNEVFEAAAGRWERIIIKDVPSFTGTIPSAFEGFPPAVDGTLDDIVIEVALAPIDGPGGILGQAGPQFVRTDDFLTLSGVMFFDVADLDFLESLDLFEEVIIHEMGHVLGVGTLWNTEPFGFPRTLREGDLSNPYFTGKMANVHWNAEGGTGELPIEGIEAGPGTGLSHWSESVLNNELMTGFLNLGENPLSRITAGSLRDLGYGTAVKGEKYDLPKGAPGVDINDVAESAEGQGLHIAKMEIILEPIGIVEME